MVLTQPGNYEDFEKVRTARFHTTMVLTQLRII